MKIYQVVIDRSAERSSSTIEAIIIDRGDDRLLVDHEGDSEDYFGIHLDITETIWTVEYLFEQIKSNSFYKNNLKLVEVK